VEELLLREMRECDDDLLLFKELFARDSVPRSIDLLRWQYLLNPGGRLLVDFAEDPLMRRLAALYAVFPVRLRVSGRQVLACTSLDTMTGGEYRRRGLFVKLAQRVFERCTREGLAFVYGFPNQNSAPGFFNNLGWTSLDPPVVLMKPLRLSSLLRRVLHLSSVPRTRSKVPVEPMLSDPDSVGSPGIVSLSGFDEETDRLWTDFSRGFVITLDRTHDYMNWRFVLKPGVRYYIRAIRTGREYDALIVYTMRDRPDMRLGHVMDLFFRGGREAAGRALLQTACQHFRRAGCGAATALSFPHSPGYRLYARSGFLAIPPVEPYKVRWGFTPLGLDDRPLLANAANWYLSYSDFDWV
jgi:GNAT superfamily N-acetyltransferase